MPETAASIRSVSPGQPATPWAFQAARSFRWLVRDRPPNPQRRIVRDISRLHLREHLVWNRVAERPVLDARGACVDGLGDIARVAGMNGKRQTLSVRLLRNGREECRVHASERRALGAGFKNRLDAIDAPRLQLTH